MNIKNKLLVLIMNSLLSPPLTNPFVRPNRQKVKAKVVQKNDYTSFIKKLDDDTITDVVIKPPSNSVTYYEVTPEGIKIDKTNVIVTEQLMDEFVKHDVGVHIESNSNALGSFLSFVLPLVIFPAVYFFLVRRFMGGGGGGSILPGQQSDLEFTTDNDTNVTFEDVAGIDEVVNEVQEYVDFLKNPEKYEEAGAKIPAGCLLYGKPGTGKTLLAKAIAGEAGVPFLSFSASQFVELYVGLGASRMRKLFENARKNSPCILFIDEIDAIGKKRSASNMSGGNDEREQTLNQFLTEMDGFKDNSGVIVIGATNRLDVLDDALLRPGRFDRKICVPLPNSEEKRKMIDVHSDNKQFDKNVDLDEIAIKTTGSSGADIKNMLNESAINAVRDGRIEIQQDDIDTAIEKVSIGLPRPIKYTYEQKKRISIHETGHAVIGFLMTDFDYVSKVSILPIGEAGGITVFTPREADMNLYTYGYLKQKMKVALGGHACEELFFGKDGISSGATADFQQVTNIAYALIKDLGYSPNVGKMQVDLNMTSEDTKNIIDKEVRELVNECYADTMKLLNKNKDTILKISNILIEKEVLKANEFEALMFKYDLKSTFH